MKTLMERDWELIGRCSLGLIFKHKVYQDSYAIERTVRLVRESAPDLYLNLGYDGVSIECNRHKLRSPSELDKFNVPRNLVRASTEVVTL